MEETFRKNSNTSDVRSFIKNSKTKNEWCSPRCTVLSSPAISIHRCACTNSTLRLCRRFRLVIKRLLAKIGCRFSHLFLQTKLPYPLFSARRFILSSWVRQSHFFSLLCIAIVAGMSNHERVEDIKSLICITHFTTQLQGKRCGIRDVILEIYIEIFKAFFTVQKHLG